MSQQFRVPRGLPIQPAQPRKSGGPGRIGKPNQSFAQVLDQKLHESTVKFSAHALKRLEARKINLSDQQLSDLETAVEKARSKGGRETLILIDDIALVVSVVNRTVITAMSGDNLRDNVFTQIDSAVIT